jgi:hypothetical protein
MTKDYPILRIRAKSDNTFECELTDPSSMQVMEIVEKIDVKTQKNIQTHYQALVEMMGNTNQRPKLTDFNHSLNILQSKIGSILSRILRNLAFEADGNCSIALALDKETVKIPWELGRISKIKGLSEPMMLSQAVCLGRLRIVPALSWSPSPVKNRRRKALVVGLNYDCRPEVGVLANAEDEADRVRMTLESNDIPVKYLVGKKATWQAVVDELKEGVDLFHFTGHGGTSWNKAKIFLADKDLWASELSSILKKSSAPSLSFFNACESCIDAPKNGKVTWKPYSWAYALANEGGNAFIGTMWSVLEPEALTFADVFYRKFLGYKNHSLGEAMQLARNDAKKGASDTFSWPAYLLYGPPTLDRNDMLTMG